jgi:hypothetical protein
MAKIRIMYWKEIPVQLQVSDGTKTKSIPLDSRFQEGVDAIAMFDGSAGTNAYLDAWHWGKEQNITTNIETACKKLADQYNNNFPNDFVKRIRDLHISGTRKPSPGAVDHWLNL